jgi:hydroxymethylbilane synthase
VEISTMGDDTPAPLTEIGGSGVFVTALRRAVLSEQADLAVHSLKDLPTAQQQGLCLVAVPERADPRDALVCPAGHTLAGLSPGARIGTGSPRRSAQLRALGLGLDIVAVRGNVETRIALAVRGEVDAVVLARAGLARLDRLDAVTEVLDPLQMLPAPGQGALAVECRSGDAELICELAVLDDVAARAAVEAERELLIVLEAGCTAPVGALADVATGDVGEEEIYLRAVVASGDGGVVLRRSATGPMSDARGVGRSLGELMLAEGAATLMGTG